MEKMTNAKALEFVLSNCDLPIDVSEKLNKMLVQVQKKSTSERKPTAVQVANEGYKALIMEVVGTTPMTCTDIQHAVPEFSDFSNQKVTSLVKALLEDGKLEKVVIKGRSHFIMK